MLQEQLLRESVQGGRCVNGKKLAWCLPLFSSKGVGESKDVCLVLRILARPGHSVACTLQGDSAALLISRSSQDSESLSSQTVHAVKG